MMTDFYRVFGDDADVDSRIPREILDELNKELPENLMYMQDDNGDCKVVLRPEFFSERINLTTQFALDPEKDSALRAKLKIILQFAPSSGHWCVCQRPLGGAQRPPLLRVFDRLNDNNVVLRCPLHYSVGRYFVIHDHRFPTPRFTLRTDDGTFGCFDAFFKDFHQYFDFPFIHDCI